MLPTYSFYKICEVCRALLVYMLEHIHPRISFFDPLSYHFFHCETVQLFSLILLGIFCVFWRLYVQTSSIVSNFLWYMHMCSSPKNLMYVLNNFSIRLDGNRTQDGMNMYRLNQSESISETDRTANSEHALGEMWGIRHCAIAQRFSLWQFVTVISHPSYLWAKAKLL